MDGNVYTYYKTSTSTEFEDDELFALDKLTFLDNPIWEEEKFSYIQLSIPQNILYLLIELLKNYQLEEHLSDFVKILAISQKLYYQKAEHLPVG